MNKFIILMVFTLFAGVGTGCGSKVDGKINDLSSPKNFIDSISYSFGYTSAHNFYRDSIEVDQEYFIRGFVDGLDSLGREEYRLVTQEEINSLMMKFDEFLMQRRKDKFDADEKANIEKGELFLTQEKEILAKNKKNPKIEETPSGLQYEVIKKGSGQRPNANQVAKIHFKGTLTDGTEFSNTYISPDPTMEPLPAFIPIDKIPPGWSEALQMMQIGSQYKFYIPAVMAYGAQGMRQQEKIVIPPNAMLIMEIELFEIKEAKEMVDPKGMIDQGPPQGPPNQGPPRR